MTDRADRGEYGEYEVESFLGKGSIGKVFLARHRRIGRRVALKTVHLDHKFEDELDRTEFYRRLQREAELCGAMQHPNIVTLYDVGYDGELVSYLATEYIDGEPLLARLRRTRPLPLREAMSIGADLLRGLAYAHSKGIIHRDIKPANILLTADGQAKIADFGVARPLHSSLTATRSLVGTPNYMSPEQVKTAPVSPRSDLFSAGVVMYEMLTGVKPFGSPELSGILYNVVNHHPPPVHEVNPSVPEELSRLVARLLAKKPEDRYATAAEALADLEALAGGAPSSAAAGAETVVMTPPSHDVTTPLPTVIAPRALRRPISALLFWSVTLVLGGAVTASVLALRNRTEEQRPTAVITREQVAANEAKERALAAARALRDQGRYAEAIAAYDAILARSPQTVVARAERDEAQRLLDAATPKAEVTKVASRKPRRERREKAAEEEVAAPAEEPKKPTRWERFKRWWRGAEKPTEKPPG